MTQAIESKKKRGRPKATHSTPVVTHNSVQIAPKRAALLREQANEQTRYRLSTSGLLTEVQSIAVKLHKEASNLEANEIQALKASAQIKLQVISKYLPDLKSVDITKGGAPTININTIPEDLKASINSMIDSLMTVSDSRESHSESILSCQVVESTYVDWGGTMKSQEAGVEGLMPIDTANEFSEIDFIESKVELSVVESNETALSALRGMIKDGDE